MNDFYLIDGFLERNSFRVDALLNDINNTELLKDFKASIDRRISLELRCTCYENSGNMIHVIASKELERLKDALGYNLIETLFSLKQQIEEARSIGYYGNRV